jgi:hypothetical protein
MKRKRSEKNQVLGKKELRDSISLTLSEKKAINEALKSIKAGKVYRHEKVMAAMKKRYPFIKF